MRKLAFLILFFTQPLFGREQGFALQCKSAADGLPKLFSYLEEDVDKTANRLDTDNFSMWDEHRWFSNSLQVLSFRQNKGEKSQLMTSLTLDRSDQSAVFIDANDSMSTQRYQCSPWEPSSRNK